MGIVNKTLMVIYILERGITMNNKWILMLVGLVFSAMIAAGCNAEPDPAPPADDQNQVDQENNTNDATDNNGNTEGNNNGGGTGNNGNTEGNNNGGTTDNNGNTEGNVPGVDENDTMTKDDEKDKDTDPEDPIEDAKDMGDENNKDQ